IKIRARWNSAEITPATREHVFAPMSRRRRLRTSSERLVAKMVTNPQPRVDIEWDTTAIFTIQINTRQDRTNANKFRVRSFQPSLAPANASSDPWKVRGRRWPQPSMPGPFRQAYLDVKGEQSLEQLGLAIKMMLAEPAARHLFAAVLE